MSNKFLRLINWILSKFKIKIISLSDYIVFSKLPRTLIVYSNISESKKNKELKLIPKSKSQLAQDILVASMTNEKENNYFVEIGAADGIYMSNTFLLEKELNWEGILVEPASIWLSDLALNRNCIIDKRCIYKKTGEKLPFLVVEKKGIAEPSLSSLKKYAKNGDWASNIRLNNSKKELVETVTLNDLLDFHKAPYVINYMSIDTEGSEFDIIKNFDFSKRKIKIISIEHNYNKTKRKNIFDKLTRNGYERIFEEISKFDDWYILNK